MQSDDVRSRVRGFVTTNFYVPNPEDVTDEESLLERGIVDSTGLLELIGFVEKTFGIKVGDDEIVPENLDGIARVASYVARKIERDTDRAA